MIFNHGTHGWANAAAIANPSGGASIDTEARAAADAILAALRADGVIAGATNVSSARVFNPPTSQTCLAAAIADPSDGATVDANLRTAIAAVLAALQAASVIAGATGPASPVYDHTTRRTATSGAIADVAAGGTTDAECRSTINTALAAMRLRGLIAN